MGQEAHSRHEVFSDDAIPNRFGALFVFSTWRAIQGKRQCRGLSTGVGADQAKAAGIQGSDIKRVCGVNMFSHWFTKSQFSLIPDKHYQTLSAEYHGHFLRPWKEIKREWDAATIVVQKSRSYFDNAHDSMYDVWHFPRVTGNERHGHATPKPVAMMERVMKSSLPKGGLCIEPFGGSGSTLIGAEKTGRVCYTMELHGKYCDVIVRRWQDFTGKIAVHAETGQPFAEVTNVNQEKID